MLTSQLVIAHIVVSEAFAGVERYVSQVASELVERGQRVVVIGGERTRMVEAMHEGVEVRAGDSWVAGLRSLLSVGPIDVIHAHMTKSEVVGVVGSIVRRTPVICTRHFGHGRGLPGLADRMLRSRLREELAVSEHVARVCPSTTETIVSGVGNADAVDAKAKVVLIAQRLEGEKRTSEAISAWARSGLADDGWIMVIAGNGAESAMLSDLTVRLGVAGSVRFDGFVPDIAGARAQAGFQVATTPNESFGLSVAEAMAAGLPVIAAAGGGHLELLADSPELLYPPGDVDSLASQMRRLASDVALRRALGARLQASQRARFTLAAHVDGLERVYERVVR